MPRNPASNRVSRPTRRQRAPATPKMVCVLYNQFTNEHANFRCDTCERGHRTGLCNPLLHNDRIVWRRNNSGRPPIDCVHGHQSIEQCGRCKRTVCARLEARHAECFARGERVSVPWFSSVEDLQAYELNPCPAAAAFWAIGAPQLPGISAPEQSAITTFSRADEYPNASQGFLPAQSAPDESGVALFPLTNEYISSTQNSLPGQAASDPFSLVDEYPYSTPGTSSGTTLDDTFISPPADPQAVFGDDMAPLDIGSELQAKLDAIPWPELTDEPVLDAYSWSGQPVQADDPQLAMSGMAPMDPWFFGQMGSAFPTTPGPYPQQF